MTTTRIVSKYAADDSVSIYTTVIHGDVDDRTARLIGLGRLFDAGHTPSSDASTEVRVDRGGQTTEPTDHVRRAQEIAGFGRQGAEVWTNVTKARNAAIIAKAGDRLTAASVAARLAGARPVMIVQPEADASVERMLWAPTPQSSRGKRIGCLLVTHGADVTGEEWAMALQATVMSAGPFPVVVAETPDSIEWQVYGSLDALRLTKEWSGEEMGRKYARIDMALRSVLWLLDDKAELPVEMLGSVDGKIRAYAMAEELLSKNWVRREDADQTESTNRGDNGIAGAVADVREFHLAAMEGNHCALLHERTAAPALVRRASRRKLLREEYVEYSDADNNNDAVGVLDALVDMAYIIIGTGLLQFGGDRFERAWQAVHESNMAKRWPDGRFHIREDGKIEKPPGWVGPDIAAIVASPSDGDVNTQGPCWCNTCYGQTIASRRIAEPSGPTGKPVAVAAIPGPTVVKARDLRVGDTVFGKHHDSDAIATSLDALGPEPKRRGAVISIDGLRHPELPRIRVGEHEIFDYAEYHMTPDSDVVVLRKAASAEPSAESPAGHLLDECARELLGVVPATVS